MKRLWLYTIMCVAWLGISWQVAGGGKGGKRYFPEYDEIVHYHADYEEAIFLELGENRRKTVMDSIKYGIVVGYIPNDLGDLYFLKVLEQIGYSKRIVPRTKYGRIDSVFTEKHPGRYEEMGCTYVFRDILLFKKKDKIIGIAKICFGCQGHDILGAAVKTKYFGQDGDYERLKMVLEE